MKIGLIGYGKMNKMIHQLAEEKGHSIIAVFDSKKCLKETSHELFQQVDVFIDFSTPNAVFENIKVLCSFKKNIVLGTTGWDKYLIPIKKIVETSNIGMIHSPNFSIGIALFLKLVDQAGKSLVSYPEYEVGGIEMHHSQKIDSPSGTAKIIENTVNCYPFHKPLCFSSVRVGNVPGTHSVMFDSPVDTITLTHTARNREGFAHGAIKAAEWIQDKKGIFTLNDLI